METFIAIVQAVRTGRYRHTDTKERRKNAVIMYLKFIIKHT